MRSTPAIYIMKWAMAILGALWLSVPVAIQILMLLFCMELVSAFFNPEAQFKKVVKTVVGSLILTAMVQIVYYRVITYTQVNLGFDVTAGVCLFYGVGSVVTTLLNFHAAGVEIPPVLLKVLNNAQGLTRKEQAELKKIRRDNER